jgi:hypothetical protein
VMVASRPKIIFWPDGSTSPGNYGWLFVRSHDNNFKNLNWISKRGINHPFPNPYYRFALCAVKSMHLWAFLNIGRERVDLLSCFLQFLWCQLQPLPLIISFLRLMGLVGLSVQCLDGSYKHLFC